MKRKYLVLPCETSEGIELMSESPNGRRIYGPGDVIELDDRLHDVAGIMGRGQICAYSEPAKEQAKEA